MSILIGIIVVLVLLADVIDISLNKKPLDKR